MKEKQECEDGQMENHGVQAEFLEAFSHIERWRAREEEETSCHHQSDAWPAKHQTVVEEVTRIWIWMVKNQMATDTSPTA
jgi:hypothetical protein